jgi:GT2 family glycosyltransferase
MKKKIHIIIVSYNDLQHLIICLESLKKVDIKGLDISIIVVDNASTKFIPKRLLRQFSNIKLIENKKNIGFGAANNIGIKKAIRNKADYILLLNPDIKANFDNKFLQKMVKFLDKNPGFGIVGPCLAHKVFNQTYYDYGGVVNKKLARACHINSDKKIKSNCKERDFVSAACMLVKADLCQHGILFDESYFLYLEDVDFCLQAKQKGYKVANLCTSYVRHYGSTSVSEKEKIMHSWKSSLVFTKKWTPKPYWLVSFLFNSFFYPYLAFSWSLKRLKRSLLRGR